jgi:isoleucyl-tRNA synthetase
VKQWGADILRLWVASQDYRNDIVVSEERIKKVAETYRLLRNTLRYQLANLFDFDPARHAVPDDRLTGLDRWILDRFGQLEQAVQRAYAAYEFHVVYQRLSQFAAVELSAIYHDVVKDRLYTDPADAPRRRSTQTALHRLVTGLCQLLAPMLAFTADEAWEFIPGHDGQSVHETLWTPRGLELTPAETARWEALFALREHVLPELEKARQAKQIGKSLEARVDLVVAEERFQAAGGADATEQLRELLNVSQLTFAAAAPADAETVSVRPADGNKCRRCWHWEPSVGQHADHPELCARCVTALPPA